MIFLIFSPAKLAESVEKMSLDTTSSENSNSVNQVDKTFLNKSPLICSESPYTTWSKLKENSADNLLKRQSSGNNNTTTFLSTIVSSFPHLCVKKSCLIFQPALSLILPLILP